MELKVKNKLYSNKKSAIQWGISLMIHNLFFSYTVGVPQAYIFKGEKKF